jgi:hypothetical protein
MNAPFRCPVCTRPEPYCECSPESLRRCLETVSKTKDKWRDIANEALKLVASAEPAPDIYVDIAKRSEWKLKQAELLADQYTSRP